MRQALSRFSAIVILILHLGLSLTDLQHFDPPFAGGTMPDAIASHDCGSKELHKALGAVHFCIPCHRILAGIAFQNVPPVTLAAPEQHVDPSSPFEIFPARYFSQTYHRGPPLLRPLA
ncbi:MAG: hypothetical protein WEB37_09530 [Bacteroidota bacterium]